MASVTLKGLSKSYGKQTILHSIDLDIADGEFIVFVGPSGCGKSTLLRLISGLDDIDRGELWIDDQLCNQKTPKQRNIAMVFQTYALYPQLTVEENIGFGLRIDKLPKKQIKEKVYEAAQSLKLTALLDRKPSQLSGGQRQRVAIGRAIVRNPNVFLLDEPLSNLDAALRTDTRIEISELHQKLKTTTIYVTHDQTEAMTMADRIVVLNQGYIEQVGTPMELYNNPASKFVAGFIGSPKMNFIEGQIAEEFGCHTLGIRPEHLELSEQSGTWPSTVTLIERLGLNTMVYTKSEKLGSVAVNLAGQQDFQLGQTVYLSPEVEHVHKFDSDGNPTK
ncbi:sn-glycerol-3-phosphate import ATP-binding protein ugpC [Vibrio nigripulchritudo SFn27]|uniref:sn-glycerol-3-phosphate import ATP-binding protein ugpC n=1 Tax=Vibrio nigripulchritudo TaxID=28173 RepID=U4K332_9VIBR|nr:ATP-binding cassette domain-containing protein [Vibrio nigripulchritudo]CCN84298.1 sn-glycerol-3-phosphate import ATP-binding protein ugpC [Vibrio nigripulchritudo BLFn1]CCN89552.1 sn-glycerol-3-phosphate import ATP-binding protein ugpC [Vibrio nigripulchritudo SFn27]CCN94020.1 sn-glycerol-3-phosphate import ATP-binding protein ugpC [Vibrio nigripulchritudo ENn2]CCO43125.1 sn-glycerol-3-phosphate import ATP-binding protein ugpC [Vibrio nigripulchritudo SFn135]CCO55368.1 sn-glycerol-3-phosph